MARVEDSDLIAGPMQRTLLYNVATEILSDSEFRLHNCELQFCPLKGELLDNDPENVSKCLSNFCSAENEIAELPREKSDFYYLSKGAKPKVKVPNNRPRRRVRKE